MAAFPLGAGLGNYMSQNLAATQQLLMNASVGNPKEMPAVSSAAMARFPGLPGIGLPPPYLPAQFAAMTGFADPRVLYSALSGAYGGINEMKDNQDTMAAWRQIAAQAQAAAALGGGPMPSYDSQPNISASPAAFPYPGYGGIDLNGSRRKNATRETTSTLKAWLYEHRKNPYPTKGEKIMLAIITKMTLTQVSTWFANARRRLKKENKMTWSPRNRTDDGSSADGDDKDADEAGDGDDVSIDLSDFDSEGQGRQLENPESTNDIHKSGRSDEPTSPASTSSEKGKPRIWSIADVATSKPQSIHSSSLRHKPYHIPSQHAAQQTAHAAQAAAGFRPWFDVQHILNGQFNPALLAGFPNVEALSSHPAFMGARPTLSPSTKPYLQAVQRNDLSALRPPTNSLSSPIEKSNSGVHKTRNSTSHSPEVVSPPAIQE